MGFGTHLIIDGITQCSLAGAELVEYIRAVALEIDMTIVLGPTAVAHYDHTQAFAIIVESHIIASGYANGQLLIDVFSCKDFDTEVPITIAIEKMAMQPGYSKRVLAREGIAS
jgi:S-adenosylmethionine/arginine decarboxylase-like enzyme